MASRASANALLELSRQLQTTPQQLAGLYQQYQAGQKQEEMLASRAQLEQRFGQIGQPTGPPTPSAMQTEALAPGTGIAQLMGSQEDPIQRSLAGEPTGLEEVESAEFSVDDWINEAVKHTLATGDTGALAIGKWKKEEERAAKELDIKSQRAKDDAEIKRGRLRQRDVLNKIRLQKNQQNQQKIQNKWAIDNAKLSQFNRALEFKKGSQGRNEVLKAIDLMTDIDSKIGKGELDEFQTVDIEGRYTSKDDARIGIKTFQLQNPESEFEIITEDPIFGDDYYTVRQKTKTPGALNRDILATKLQSFMPGYKLGMGKRDAIRLVNRATGFSERPQRGPAKPGKTLKLEDF